MNKLHIFYIAVFMIASSAADVASQESLQQRINRITKRENVVAELRSYSLRTDIDELTRATLARLSATVGDLNHAKKILEDSSINSGINRSSVALTLIKRGRINNALDLVNREPKLSDAKLKWIVLTGIASPDSEISEQQIEILKGIGRGSFKNDEELIQCAILCRRILKSNGSVDIQSEEKPLIQLMMSPNIRSDRVIAAFLSASMALIDEDLFHDYFVETASTLGDVELFNTIRLTCDVAGPRNVANAIGMIEDFNLQRRNAKFLIDWITVSMIGDERARETLNLIDRYKLEADYLELYVNLCYIEGLSAVEIIDRFPLDINKMYASLHIAKGLVIEKKDKDAISVLKHVVRLYEKIKPDIEVDERGMFAKDLLSLDTTHLKFLEIPEFLDEIYKCAINVQENNQILYPNFVVRALIALVIIWDRLGCTNQANQAWNEITENPKFQDALFSSISQKERSEILRFLDKNIGTTKTLNLFILNAGPSSPIASNSFGSFLAEKCDNIQPYLALLGKDWVWAKHGVMLTGFLETKIRLSGLELIEVPDVNMVPIH